MNTDLPVSLRAVDTPGAGRLWLSAMPGRAGAWADFLDDARRARLDLVLCLTPRFEIDRLSPDYAAAIDAGTLPFDWRQLPMRDFGLFAQIDVFERAVDEVVLRLQGGGQVMLHCAAGIGRTGTTAACVLMRLGLGSDDALARVRRAGSNPESVLQSGLVSRFQRGPA